MAMFFGEPVFETEPCNTIYVKISQIRIFVYCSHRRYRNRVVAGVSMTPIVISESKSLAVARSQSRSRDTVLTQLLAVDRLDTSRTGIR